MSRIALAVAIAAGSVAVFGGAAAAHAVYVRSTPAADARLVKSPTEIRVTFSETPEARGSEIEVLDQTGRRFDKAGVGPTEDPSTLRVAVDALGDGGYIVNWTVLSAVDGHTSKGAFVFSVNAPLPQIPDIGEASAPPGPLELFGRILSFAGIALAIGTAFFVRFVNVPIPREAAVERRLLIVGGSLLLIGALALLAVQGTTTPLRLAALLSLRAIAGAIVIGSTWLPPALVGPRLRREFQLSAGLTGALTATAVSHAAATGQLVQMALDFTHVAAISVWSGGVAALLAFAWHSRAASDNAKLGSAVWRFSLTALVCVAVLLTTGVLQSFDRLVLLEDLVETPYGLALLAKIVLLVGLVGLGALNLLRWGPRIRAGSASRAGLIRTMAGETALFAGVFVAAAFLTALAPPASANGAAFDETQRVDGLRIELLAATNTPGRNRYIVRVHEGLRPVGSAERVALRFTLVEHDMGEQELIATERGPGEYVAEGSPTAMFGTWKVQTIVRLRGRPDARALFTVPVTPPVGQETTSKVIAVPPLNLVVFTEPAAPQAGAPISLYVVVVNANGDPVSGRTVQASFTGPGTQPPIDAVENRAETGPGRYRISIAALDAGTWKASIAVSGAGTGIYEFNVSR